MSYPKNKEEWWESVDNNWDSIKNIVLAYYPNQEKFPAEGYDYESNTNFLHHPQAACNRVIKEIQSKSTIITKKELEEGIELLRKYKDKKLNIIFQDTWFGMPETPQIRNVRGFHVFCDLCSECHVLKEKEETLCSPKV